MLALSVAIPWLASAQVKPAGAASSPLTLQASCDAQTLHVQIANTSDKPTSVVLGFNAGNAQTHVVNSLAVIVIRIATGAEEPYVYVNPKFALAEGPPWIVPLAPGAAHNLDLPLKDFISGMSYTPLDPAVAGGGSLELEGKAAGKLSVPVWTGRVRTMIDRCR